ncbi:MAG: TonB-dependent receptor [Opitutaceae bacterium]|jgi:outer membrane receptor protein involved in Fe transport
MSASHQWRLLTGLFVLPILHAGEIVELDPVDVSAAMPGDAPLTQPTPITAYRGSLLASTGTTTYEELAPLVPGFFASAQSVDNISLNLRGLTTDAGDPRIPARVPVFQDGVVISSPRGGGTALFDLQSVEVLKGPQPTAFGRGVQNGTLSITDNPALNETSGEFTAGLGDYNSRLIGGYYNAPLISEKLFVRTALSYEKNDGYVKNLTPGAESLQGRDTLAVRTSLRWQPAPDTTADLIVNIQHDNPPGIAFKSAVNPTAGSTNPYTAAELNRGNALGIDRDLLGVTGVLKHQLSQNWNLTSTSALRTVDSRDEFDADGSSLYLFEFGEHTTDRQLSQELRLDYDAGDRLTAMIGTNFLWEQGEQDVTLRTDENRLYKALTGMAPPFPLLDRYQESYAIRSELFAADVFGHTDYKLTEKLTLGAGLRITQEHIVSGYQSFAAPVPGNIDFIVPTAGGGNDAYRPTPGRLEADTDATSWTGRLDARYAFTPRHQAYASVSRGRRPPVLTFDQRTFALQKLAEERVWNYEAGFKGTTANRRVQYGVSVFQYYYDNFQTDRVVSPGVTAPFDGGRARGQGLEATLQGTVTTHLSLFATYGYTDAKFSALAADGTPQAYAGNSFRLTSLHTVSLGGTVTAPAGDRGVVFITPVAQYRSEQYFEDDNAAAAGTLRQGGFALFNLRFGYRPLNGRWEITGYLNNVFDKNYLIDAGNIGLSFGLPTTIRGDPRTTGMQATVRF